MLLLGNLLFINAILGQSQSAASYTENRYFRTISVEQGLSQSTVFVTAQDQQGFIWVGTQDGLNRYDGQTFTIFRPSMKEKNSLFSNYIRSLYADKQGLLWIGGNKGISSYNYKTEQFSNYPLPVKPGEWFISSIITAPDNQLWITSNTGEIYYYNSSDNQFVSFRYRVNGSPFGSVQQLLFINQNLFLATNKGLYKVNTNTGMADMLPQAGAIRINALLQKGHYLWMGSESNGLFCMNLRNNEVKRYVHQSQNDNSLIDNDIRSLAWDEAGQLWIGTFRGLSIFNLQSSTFKNFIHQSSQHLSLSQNSVRCIFRDRQNGMWLGTFFGGLNYYHKDDFRFNVLSQTTGNILLNDQVVSIIREDPLQNIWIGTNDNGINIWNRKTNRATYLIHNEAQANTLSSNNIKAIEFDNSGNALVGTFNGGLNYIDTKNYAVKVYLHNPGDLYSISSDMVHAILRDRQGRIWVGTKEGLNLFDADRQQFSLFKQDALGKQLSSEGITSLLQDQKGRIWIGTINGINVLSPDLSRITIFKGHTLTNELVNCIAEDRNGRIWAGTRDGLNVLDEKQQRFVPYTGPDNAIQGAIFGIQPDNDDGIWISTSQRLIKISDRPNRIQAFDNRNGLGNIQFSLPAYCKASDGMMLFGGLNGIIYFYPQALQLKPLDLHITFTGLDIFNMRAKPGGNFKVLEKAISETKQLNLQHEHKQFTVYFSALNYISPGSIKYQYLLKGFDNTWQVCENIPKVSYTNLKPGNYTLQVQATGPMGEKSQVSTLQICILSPWWRSNWFYFITLLVLAMIGYIIKRVISERIHTKKSLQRERVEREKSEHLSRMKMEFFTNISHEFRTPLTLIIAPLEEVLSKDVPEKKLRKYHERMLGNAKQLYQLVDQLMDFRKTENGLKQLEPATGEIISFLRGIYASFLELSHQKKIHYLFKANYPEFNCSFDKDAVGKICNNLLSNAFKYTQANDTIELIVELQNNKVLLTVKDTGQGISAKDHERVFERFYQVNPAGTNPGSGVGLAFTKSLVELHKGTITVDSAPGKGTSFLVSLPLNESLDDSRISSADNHYELLLDNLSSLEDSREDEHKLAISETDIPQQQLLIVDDNEQIVAHLTHCFENQFSIRQAYSGSDALLIIENELPDIIICDVMMPGVDGIQFCKKVKQNIHTCHIPVILLTAKTEIPNQIKGLEAGADDYITKPFSLPVLEAKVQNIIRSRRRLKEYYSASTEIIPENIALNTLDEDFLRRAIEIVEHRLSDPDFSVLKFSREIGMSRSSLYLKLKAITGESTTDFIKRIKFKKAASLLESRQYSITEIAYMSGFSSPSYFSTSFKQYYGHLPTEHLSNRQQADPGNNEAEIHP